MKLLGKCPPDPAEFAQYDDWNISHIELLLETAHLDAYADTLAACQQASVAIDSVHAPHLNVDTDDLSYLRLADQLAGELDATLVLDANPFGTRYITNLFADYAFDAPAYGFENDPSVSAYYLQETHLANGHPFILDTAHLYMSEADYLDATATLLDTAAPQQIPLVHLADGTRTQDGLNFGEGTIDMTALVEVLDTHYDGPIVLEFPPETQPDAYAFVCDHLAQ